MRPRGVKDFFLRPHSSDSTQGWDSNPESSDPKAHVVTSDCSVFQSPSSLRYSTTEAFLDEQSEAQVTLPKVTEIVEVMVSP